MSRDDLIMRHLPLARALALRYRGRGQPLEDLVQVASLGLVKAAARWEPERGAAFATFATPTILGELRRYFRDFTWDVRPPRTVQELWLAIAGVREPLIRALGHEPTVDELATRLGCPPEAVAEALRAGHSRRVLSLDDEVLADHTPARDDELGGVEAGIAFEQLIASLDERAQEVVRLRFDGDLIQKEIGAHVGLSQMAVSRTLRASLAALAARLASPPATLAA